MNPHRIGLFKTCLADVVRPSVPAAALMVLKSAGYDVSVPKTQTCCSQPAFNSGDTKTSRMMAESIIETFEEFDYVVAASGSCIGMLKIHLLTLFEGDEAWLQRARALAAKSWEILSFLTEVAEYKPSMRWNARVTYHDSCAGLRELGIKWQPRKLLQSIDGVEIEEMNQAEVCCGFGGTFCVKFPPISARLADKKIASAMEQQPQYLVGGDLGCLLHICGRAQHEGINLQGYHLIEVLAGLVGEIAPLGVEREG